MESQVKQVIEDYVNPILSDHFGSASVSKVIDNVVYVRLNGACASCPSAQNTVEETVKTILMEKMPEIEDVVLDTSVSEDLLEMAKKILSK